MRLLIFAVVIMLLENCSSMRNKNEISGNWCTCGKDGLYDELIIKDNLFKQSADNGIITEWCEFKIEGDTFTTFDPFLFKDSVVVHKAKITFVDRDEIVLDYITSDEHWVFHRMDEDITDIDDHDKLLEGTRKRSEKIKCPILVNKDSLGFKPIKFQF